MRLIAVLCICAAVIPAQTIPIPQGAIVFTDSNPPSISMLDPVTGSITLLSNATSLVLPAGVCPTADGDICFVDNTARTVHRLDLLGTITNVTTGPLVNSPTRIAEDYDGTFIIANTAAGSWAGMPGGSPGQLTRIDSTGTWSTVVSLQGNPFGVHIHPEGSSPFGDYVTGMPLVGDLVRVDAIGTLNVLTSGMWGITGVAQFPNGDYCVTQQYNDTVYRIPRNGGTPTVYVAAGTGLGNIKDILTDGEGGFYVAEAGGTLGSRIMHIDPTGTITQVLGNSAFGTLQAFCVMPKVRVPTSLNTGGVFGLALGFPSHPGKSYITVASGSVFPGIAFPGADPRGISINPDPIFLMTFGTGVPGLTTGWAGTLDGLGNAVLTIDLSIYPPNAFANSRIYMQTGVVDPMAPTGIAQVGELATLAFN